MNIELSVVKLKTIIAWSCAHIVKNNIDIFIYTWYIQPYLFYEFVIMPILFDIHWHHSKLRCICYALVFHEANYSINENVCVINIFMKQILLCRRKNSKLRCTFFTEEKKIKFSHKKVSVASIALEMSKKLHLDLRENIKSYNLN